MKQVLESLRSGTPEVADVPPTRCRPSGVLVWTVASFVSSGTERASLRLASRTLAGKALARPELARQFLARLKTAGPAAVMAAVRARLDQPLPLGYSSAGIVVEVGSGVDEFAVGDRVACAGSGYAGHAEVNWVPRNLCVNIPSQVDFESAASAALGAVALQGVRVAEARIGDRVVVVGLGVIGLLTAQILNAAGCVVCGSDPDAERVRLAQGLGIEAATSADGPWLESSMDAVILTAATSSRGPIELAGRLARDRGVVVVVGDVRVDIPREPYYAKELQVRYSRSYGPGRYDARYEEQGLDYPYGFVRWTEKRNLEAYLRLLADGKICVKPLVSHRFPIEEARHAYALLSGERPERSVGIVLTFPNHLTSIAHRTTEPPCRSSPTVVPQESLRAQRESPQHPAAAHGRGKPTLRLGWIGAGSFSQAVLLPALAKVEGVALSGVANRTGASALQVARRFGFCHYSADAEEILSDPEIDAVVIATRHDLHARLVVAALERGKHVFVEKPLGISEGELAAIERAYAASGRILAVGFNRRFSPFARECLDFFDDSPRPVSVLYRVNAGPLPAKHWLHAPEQGNGRLTGELCHFIDLIQFVLGSKAVEVYSRAVRPDGSESERDLHVTIRSEDGSLAEIHYLCSGPEGLGKERIEVFGRGRAAVCDDFRRWRFVARSSSRRRWLLRQDKGHQAELDGFVRAARGLQPWPVDFTSVRNTTLATFRIAQSSREGRPVAV
jgi:predicted dehydrogenase